MTHNRLKNDTTVFEERFASQLISIVRFLTDFKERYLEYLTDDQALRDRIEYVVMEAVDNAYEHGNHKDETKSIVVRCRQKDELLGLSILDEGQGFDKKIPGNMPDMTNLNGRGLFSIRELAHSVSFNDRGNMITIIFKTR